MNDTTPRTNRQAALISYRAASDVAARGAMFVITVAAARRLPPHAFGLFAVATTLGWLLSVVTDCGLQLHLARAVAQAPERAAALLGRWLSLRVLFAAVALALLAAGVGGAIAGAWISIGDGAAVLLLAAAYVAGGVSEFLYYFFRASGRSDLESSLTLVQRGTTVVAAVVLLWWLPSLVLLSVLVLLPAVLTLGFAVECAWRVARSSGASVAGEDRRPLLNEFSRDVLPLGAGIIASALYFRIDMFLVGSLAGLDAAGMYNAVFRVVDALRLVPAAVLAVLLPAVLGARDSDTMRRVVLGLSLFGAGVAFVGELSAGWVVPLLFGDPYVAAIPTFRVLLLAFPLLSLNYALTHQLVGWHGQRAYAAIALCALALNLALNARLIPASGMIGAAWATVATEVFLSVACVARLRATASRRAGITALGATT